MTGIGQRSRIGTRPPAAFLGSLGIAIVLVEGLVVSTVGRDLPFGFDQAWHDFLASHRSPVADIFAGLLDIVGGTLAMTIATVGIVVLLAIRRRFRAAVAVALTVAIGSGICSLIKMTIARPRPLDGVLDITSDAFPSGHTTTAASLTIAIALAFPRVWAWVLASAWIALMATSRNYLLVHWLSDVIAGAALGASIALLVSAAVRAVATRACADDKHSAWARPRRD